MAYRRYRKRGAAKDYFLLPIKAKFDNDLLICGQLNPFDQADQQLPAGGDGFQKPSYQFFARLVYLAGSSPVDTTGRYVAPWRHVWPCP